jgi:hypothetical protein
MLSQGDFYRMKWNWDFQLTSSEIFAVALFLIVWTLVETVTGTGSPSRSAPGTTYHAAASAGATVTPSEQPSSLEQQPIKPAPAPRQ